MRHACMLIALSAGCGGSSSHLGEPTRLLDGATLAAVSVDQKQLAYYTGAAMLTTGAQVGTLSVLPLPGGPALKLDDNAFSATYFRGNVLVYQTGQVASMDMGSRAIYGALHLFAGGMSGAARLGAGLAIEQAEPPDNSFVLFADGAMPTRNQPMTLTLVRAAECSAAACQPQIIAAGRVVSMLASPDGTHAAYVVRAGMMRMETWLVRIADGKPAMLGLTPTTLGFPAPIAFSPDSSLIAFTVGNGGELQLKVASVASQAQVAWAPQPVGTSSVQLAFADASTLILHAVGARNDHAIFRSTPSGNTRISNTGRAFYLPQQPPGASRYLLVQTNQNGGTGDAQLFDLKAAAPTGVPLAHATVALPPLPSLAPAVSEDLKYLRFLEDFDPLSRYGKLMAAALPGGGLATVSTSVSAYEVGFVPGSGSLLYVDNPDNTGAGTLTEWTAGSTTTIGNGVFNFRLRAPSPGPLYVSITELDSTFQPPITPGIYSEPVF